MKKLTCVILIIMMLFSAISVSAVETENSSLLHFDVNSAGWTDFKFVFCHIQEYDGAPFFPWQGKKERCDDTDGDGIFTYDLKAKGIELKDNTMYYVIFSTDTNEQTYTLLFDSTVLGDIAYCDGTLYEDISDSSKTMQAAFWKNQNETNFGPEKCITFMGNVIGTCLPTGVTSSGMFEYFLEHGLSSAEHYSGKTVQQIIDDVAVALDLSKLDVSRAVCDTFEYSIGWNSNLSPLEYSEASFDEIEVKRAVREYRETSSNRSFTTKRYYFLRPDGISGKPATDKSHYEKGQYIPSWDNEYSEGKTCITWSDTAQLQSLDYPGFVAMSSDEDDIFYADIPDFVTDISWNNGVKYSGDYDDTMWLYARKTVNIPCEYYDEGENETYPDGLDSFENMIFVLDPDQTAWGCPGEPASEPGEWYYYYGDGCYGVVENGTMLDCIRGGHHDKGGSDDRLYLEQFRKYANLDEYDSESYSYSGPLFYYYEKGKDEPSWFLARGNTGSAACAVIYGIFDDYFLINNYIEYPSDFNWHVYIYEEDKFYALEDIWEEGFADKEIAFSAYLVPNGYAGILGDADGDGELSVLDATQIQMQIAGLCEREERIPASHHFGDEVIYQSDIDHDGDVSVLDATQIQMKLAGLK